MINLIFSNTDSERLLILAELNQKISKLIEDEIGISENQISKIEKYFDIFEKLKSFEDFVKSQQEKEDKEFAEIFNKAKIFVVHYFKSLFMAIERGELTPQTANYYGLNYPFEIPNPKNADELLEIAETLFNSDAMRIGSGGKYFVNPAIGTVKVWVEKFQEAWQIKKSKFIVKKAEVENIDKIRLDTDQLIYELFELLNSSFEAIETEERVQLFAEYGLKVEYNAHFDKIENIETDNTKPETFEGTIETKKDKRNSGKTDCNQLKFDLFF